MEWEGHPDQYANGLTDFLLVNEWFNQPRMLLVPAASSIDALLAARGTPGIISGAPEHVSGLAAVLRSWERRFGTRVIALRSDTLFLSVAATPDSHQAAHIACEHFVFAPDNVEQNADSFPEYVESITGSNLWIFWWD